MALKASRSTLALYGVGAISPAVKGNLLGSFLFYYYNQVLGLSPGLVSVALALALVVDAISDPMLGYFSDHTRSRLGRRHPYIYASLIPSGAFYYFLLTASFGTSQTALFCQLLILITGLRLAWTFYQVPRDALGAELSKDYEQRNQLHGLSSFFGWIGGAGIAYVTSAVFLGDSYDNLQGYHELAFWGGGTVLLAGLAFTIGTHRNIPELETPRDERARGLRAVLKEILETLNHRSWLMLFLAGVVFSVYIGLSTGLGIYFNRFFWDWKPSDIAIFAIVDLAAALAISAFAGFLTRGWDKKRMALGLFSISIVVGPILLILRILDLWYGTNLLPENGDKYGTLWWVMLGHNAVLASLGVLAWILVGSMTADVVEDSQTRTGRRSEGLFFAGPALIQKSISGLGFIIKGSILTLVGFSVAETDADKVLAVERLAVVFVVLGIALPALSLWIFSKYQITQEVHEENLSQLGYQDED
ncbi:MAG: MFS transporter [Myxococcota bacterium]|nr:MFS transporter [Myxococcota bacterium]